MTALPSEHSEVRDIELQCCEKDVQASGFPWPRGACDVCRLAYWHIILSVQLVGYIGEAVQWPRCIGLPVFEIWLYEHGSLLSDQSLP
jgi:hypothetical protein